MKRSQSGVTLIGLLFWAVLIGSFSLVVLKTVPAITEFRTIRGMVDKAAQSGSTVPEIRAAFDREKDVNYGIESITSKDLDITKEGDKVVVRFAYDREIELVDPVYLLLKFSGESQ